MIDKTVLERIENYCTNTYKENAIMCEVLKDFVNQAGGKIDINDETGDTLWFYAYDEYDEHYQEYAVDCVKVENDCLMLHTSDLYSTYDIDDDKCWYNLMGGMVLINATIYNLCEVLPQYVK